MQGRGLRYMTRMDWGWLSAKFTTGVLVPTGVLLWVPSSVREGYIAHTLVATLMFVMLIGGLLSILGIILRGARIKPLIIGYAIEIGGITALVTSPLILGVVYGVYAWNTGSSPMGMFFCLGLAAPFVARGIDILYDHLAPLPKDARPVITGQVDEPDDEAA